MPPAHLPRHIFFAVLLGMLGLYAGFHSLKTGKAFLGGGRLGRITILRQAHPVAFWAAVSLQFAVGVLMMAAALYLALLYL